LHKILLDTQGRNRRVKLTLVEKIARDIVEGRWQLNAQPILIDSEARLGDGQHRCLAVIKSGHSVPVVVTFGISANAFATLDSGLSRSPSDMLFLRGEKAATNLSRALNLISLYKRGLMSEIAGVLWRATLSASSCLSSIPRSETLCGVVNRPSRLLLPAC